jgi:sugar phosphate isomerase/epimerase
MTPGLQLYSVSEPLASDFGGTLARVAEIGFRTVEVAGFLAAGRTGREIKSALDVHGLKAPSVHFGMPELLSELDSKIAFAHELGASMVVCAAPWIRDMSKLQVDPSQGMFAAFFAAIAAMDLDDWRWNAENLNRIGESLRQEGLELAYHGHNFEFREFDGVVAYDELLRLTDPAIVKLELDCGWVAVAGRDPVWYLRNHPERCRIIHVRDFERGFEPTTEMRMTSPELLGPATPAIIGDGVVNYPEVIRAARAAGVKYAIVERDPFWKGRPILELLKADYRRLQDLLLTQ